MIRWAKFPARSRERKGDCICCKVPLTDHFVVLGAVCCAMFKEEEMSSYMGEPLFLFLFQTLRSMALKQTDKANAEL